MARRMRGLLLVLSLAASGLSVSASSQSSPAPLREISLRAPLSNEAGSHRIHGQALLQNLRGGSEPPADVTKNATETVEFQVRCENTQWGESGMCLLLPFPCLTLRSGRVRTHDPPHHDSWHGGILL